MKMNGKGWRIFGASMIGSYHIKNNLPNQDSFYISNKLLSVAVADGLGSKRFSHYGSKYLAKFAVRLSRLFYKNQKAFEEKLSDLWITKLKKQQINYEDASSTLMLVFIKNKKIYIAKIGDGAIIILGKKNIVVEEGNKIFSNATTPFGYDRLKWSIFDEKDIDFIFISTDGISDDIEDKIGFAKYFKKYFLKLPKYRYSSEGKEILKNWRVKGSSDDKTFVAMIKDKNGKK